MEIKDWKGNEIKAGMTIYFIQTKPGVLESSRQGIMLPQTGETIWEPEENWLERKNKEIWELGKPYLVSESQDGSLRITVHYDDPDIESITMPLFCPLGGTPTIAIKGISDKNIFYDTI